MHLCLYLMYVGWLYPTYVHTCTGYSSYELEIHTDTGWYRLIQVCVYAICTVHIQYELVCIMCISMCISVCMFDRYSTDIPVHICVICVCIFGRYAHAGSLMFSAYVYHSMNLCFGAINPILLESPTPRHRCLWWYYKVCTSMPKEAEFAFVVFSMYW